MEFPSKSRKYANLLYVFEEIILPSPIVERHTEVLF